MSIAALLLAVFCLAYANGANDNFKGVATLFGSGAAGFRGAVTWATLATGAGSLAAILLAHQLLRNFSGKGLVDDTLTANPDYLAAVACGAGLTVTAATRMGLPVSTTHGLLGALVGAAWAGGSSVNFETLGITFVVPLLVSPLLAMASTALVYSLLHAARLRAGVTEETCFCVGRETIQIAPGVGGAAVIERAAQLTASTGTSVICRNRYVGRFLGIEVSGVVDRLHFLSAGAVSFARGVNDTPKIAAMLLAVPFLRESWGIAGVAGLMAFGGIAGSRKVAETMSCRITTLNHGQGASANLVTSMIVLLASRQGLPVSTTHVSCGALFGIGLANRNAHWKTIGTILAAWITTLPMGGVLGALSFRLIESMGSRR